MEIMPEKKNINAWNLEKILLSEKKEKLNFNQRINEHIQLNVVLYPFQRYILLIVLTFQWINIIIHKISYYK